MSEMTHDEALGVLKSRLDAGSVPARDLEFVSSLVGQSATRGLSSTQWYWVVKLATRFTAPAREAKAVGNFQRVYSLVRTAQTHLKYPKIRLRTSEGRDIAVYMSTQRSRVPDTLNVVGNGGEWYGRVYQDGKWEAGSKVVDTALTDVESTLKALAEDPEGTASAYGKLVGSCCFCGRELTDERSTSVGYGPVCADHFGLAWG